MWIPAGFAQITHHFGGTGYPLGAAIVFGVDNNTIKSADDLAEETHNILQAEWQAFWTLDTTLLSTTAKRGPNPTGSMATYVETVIGTGSADTMSPNTALLLNKNTASGGRSNRGRVYMPGLADTSVIDGGDIGSGAMTAAISNCNDWLAALAANDTPMVVLHNDVSAAPTAVTSLVPNARAATQRKRLRR